MKYSTKIIGLLLFLFTAVAFSSGGFDVAPSTAANYDVGKKVFLEKVVCESCPYPELELDPKKVEEILPDLHRKGSIGKLLSLRDRKSVNLFVRKRFNI